MDVITIETPSLGDRSYIVHDGKVGLVIDPQRDIDRVLGAAADADIDITHIAETHVHNDYVSGGLTLSRVTGAAYVHASDEPVRFDHVGVGDGDHFTVGDLDVTVLATPGHTPHHLSYVVTAGDEPPVAFTGGSLLHGTVGRTDLIGADLTETLTREQHRSAHRLADSLPDDASIHPTHGFGSFCASVSSDEESDGRLGTERSVNIALTTSEDAFVERLLSSFDAYPRYYAHMGPMNLAGAVAVDLSPAAVVDPVEIARRIHRGEWVVDIRRRCDFAAGHVFGTIGIELDDGFSTYLAWLVPWGMPITLLADSADHIAQAQRQLVRVGIDRPSGAADGGLVIWGHGCEWRSYRRVTFADLPSAAAVLDVRQNGEHDEHHLRGAVHIPLHELLDRLDEVPDSELFVHCASGYRASIAASLLDRAGYDVVLVDDDIEHAAESGRVIE